MNDKEITIKILAEELNISKPTVSAKIKELGIKPTFKASRYILTSEQAETVKKAFLEEKPKISQSKTKKTEKTEKSILQKSENFLQESENPVQILKILQNQIEIKDKQIEVKDKQIEALTKQIETLTLLLNQQQQLTALVEMKELPSKAEEEPKEETTEEKRQNPFKKFFKR